MALPAEVQPVVDALLTGAKDALGDNLVGFYLRGSLALGDFDPRTSDVDCLAVTENRMSDGEYAALEEVHERLGWKETIFGRHYEVSYIDRKSLKAFLPGQRKHPTVGADWAFGWAEHHDNFIFERWVTREHGLALLGPDPATLIDPISSDDLRAAVQSEFSRLADWVTTAEASDFLKTRHYQAFAIETICRGLYTLEHGTVTTKPRAIEWALSSLPEPWRALAEWSREHHADKREDPAKIPEVIAFVRSAADEASSPAAAIEDCGAMSLPAGIEPLTDALHQDLRDALGDNLTGIYLTGSLALGGYDPESSDVDILVVTERAVSDAELNSLRALHQRLPPENNAFSLSCEVYYMDRGTLRRFAPGQSYIKVGPGEPFGWRTQRPNWVLERWIARERGIVVAGVDPKALIDPILPDELREAAAGELRVRAQSWRDGTWPLEELDVVAEQAYQVHTVCRALYTMATGSLSPKPEALVWALSNLPVDWHGLIRWSRDQRGNFTLDKTRLDDVTRFLDWAVAKSQAS